MILIKLYTREHSVVVHHVLFSVSILLFLVLAIY